MKLGPATALVDFAKECKEKKLRSFSSYKTKKELGEVLRKYGIDSNEITKIPPFEPEPVEIDDEDEEAEELEQCITEIKRRMGIIGSATGRNEAVLITELEAKKTDELEALEARILKLEQGQVEREAKKNDAFFQKY
ncbi:hypothetical protein RhiirA1_542842 [Rhizophagus irregularis]|uniref:Uncharacterized protein n=1 Tax=Rhizophagus irregularis TaxID=588596 RepID=A0A2N0QU14_9GLOM|nr:hypothetical protein RhiirA1_542842 [Rhizophagus irregularis]